MKLRRTISFLLLAVYLLLAAGSALRSLSCECVAMGGHAHDKASCCRHACCAARFAVAAVPDGSFAAPCCDDRHSTEIALYTVSDTEGDKAARCAVIHLPASLAVECPCPAHAPLLRRPAIMPSVPLPAAPLPGLLGLRAPPVTV